MTYLKGMGLEAMALEVRDLDETDLEEVGGVAKCRIQTWRG